MIPFQRAFQRPENLSQTVHAFLFQGRDIILKSEENGLEIPTLMEAKEAGFVVSDAHYLGRWHGEDCFNLGLEKDQKLPNNWQAAGLRDMVVSMGEEAFFVAGYAYQLHYWDVNSRYCGRCGNRNKNEGKERAKKCFNCGLLSYPRISPAVIMAVTKGDKILLASAARFQKRFYSVLAGFVEPGETLEECVQREVKEETNIEVKNIRYFGSQPWPFPDSLMIGFTAEYASGTIKIDPTELEDANWYAHNELPNIPPRLSIARQLIDDYLNKHAGK